MSLKSHIKTILLSLCLGGVTLLHSEPVSHPFEVESGMVIYEIYGGAQLTAETNLSIKGQGKLRFKEWGEIRLEEEGGMVLTTGAIKHKQYVKRLEKQTKDTVITADYKNEQLLERKKGKGIVLKSESNVYDVSYVKVATKALFDINTSDEECEVPDYPLQEFALGQKLQERPHTFVISM